MMPPGRKFSPTGGNKRVAMPRPPPKEPEPSSTTTTTRTTASANTSSSGSFRSSTRVFSIVTFCAVLAILWESREVDEENSSCRSTGKHTQQKSRFDFIESVQKLRERPLCPIDDPSLLDDGSWIRDASVKKMPYFSGDVDAEWCPRCVEAEKEYNATGKVPDPLLYQWQPRSSCDVAKFDPKTFCRLLDGKTIGFMGDSIQQQFAHSLIGLMKGRLVDVGEFNGIGYSKLLVQLCDDESDDEEDAKTVSFIFQRWDAWASAEHEHVRLADLAFHSDILVLNFGAHFQPWDERKTNVQDMIKVLQQHWKAPHKRPEHLFWRSTIVAHNNCQSASGPTNDTFSLFYGYHEAPNYHTAEIMKQERDLVRPMLQRTLQPTFLRMENSMAQRPDGHRVVGRNGAEDCLHYCEPGPTDHWVDLFYHNLIMMTATRHTGSALVTATLE